MLVLLLGSLSCKEYLDIVPDDTITLDDFFSRKEMAWNALAKIYSYLPDDPHTTNTSWTLGDEWIGRLDLNNNTGDLRAIRLMRGLQNTEDPLLATWSGQSDEQDKRSLYMGIRSANIFLEYIDMAADMSETEIGEWKAQAKFLKAYYHFLLLRQYGPIVIADDPVDLDALSEELFQKRSKVEDCLNFIIRLMDEAIPDLKERTGTNDLGQVDKVAALSIKARILLFRASPFLNGNREYYGDFLDYDGQPFFPLDSKPEKWQDALEAVNAAITLCETNGLGLYKYERAPYIFDREDYILNPEKVQTLYDLRMVIADPWNNELIWGQTYGSPAGLIVATSNIRLPENFDGEHGGGYCEQSLAASYKMLERYYTKNGIPPSDDLTFDFEGKYDLVTTPLDSVEYTPLRGFLQPNVKLVKLYMNREPRFYANLGITGGYWRSHAVRINTKMLTNSNGGLTSSYANNFLCTGIGVQKFVHPESKADHEARIVKCPYPIIRMADLYLMKAEILNEIEGPSPRVYAEINKVRKRAGIPNVETVWADATIVRNPGKHLTKDGMLDIILHERSVEFAFEGGNRFWDMHRYKKAMSEFSSPILGWNYSASTEDKFFVTGLKQTRRFLARDYLWPLSLKERNVNSNLIQNPGW
jgi:hypothetical protein